MVFAFSVVASLVFVSPSFILLALVFVGPSSIYLALVFVNPFILASLVVVGLPSFTIILTS